MFTGIIEAIGKVVSRDVEKGNIHFGISAPFISELKVDQSVAHNGVCLTVVKIFSDHFIVTAISETLEKSNLADLKVDDEINLERCLKIGDRLDGHMVQGHVDTTAVCKNIQEENGSWRFDFSFDATQGVTVSKGSICVNGVSLTVATSLPGEFSVAIIPFTFGHTNFHSIKIGNRVNIEFDIVGKYVLAMMNRA